MKVMRAKKRVLGAALAAAVFLAALPGAAFATTPPSVTLGKPSLSATATTDYTFPDATVTGDVATLTVSLSGVGTIDGADGATVTGLDGSSVTFKGLTVDKAQEKLRALIFRGVKCTTEITVTADANETSNIPEGATLAEIDGHYYMYVPEKLSWSKAYNAAKGYKYNGMQGYLATLTSADEYEALHDKVRAKGGWIGSTLIVKNDGSDTKILDDDAVEQKEGAYTYPATKTNYNQNRSGAINDYYWACGPEAGQAFMEAVSNGLLDLLEVNEPNAYHHNNSPWAGQENILKLTQYECCLLANNNGKLTINDIAEPGYDDDGYAQGYFVEFGGYDEGKDPGNPDASLTKTESFSFSAMHEHKLDYNSVDGEFTVTCASSSDALCSVGKDGLTLSLLTSGNRKMYDGTAANPFPDSSQRKAWKAAGLSLPKVTIMRADENVSYSENPSAFTQESEIKKAGYYFLQATIDGANASTEYAVKKTWFEVWGFAAKDKIYDGNKTAELDDSKTKTYGAISGDDVSVSATCEFEDKIVGQDKKVTISNVSLKGADAGNYTLYALDGPTAAGPTAGGTYTAAASITEREVELNWGSAELEYTGKDQVRSCELGNTVEGDKVELSVSGAQSAAGKDYEAIAALTGEDATNYGLPENSTENFSIVEASISPVVSIEGWTYGDDANEPSLEKSTNPGNGEVTYEYSKKDEGAWSKTVPTAAGDYTVRASVAATANYKAGTATADFTIAPKSIAAAKVVLGAGLTANGSEQEQGIESVTLADGTKLVEGDYELSGNKATAAGTYTLTVTGVGNYKDAVEVSFTVAANPNEVAANEAVDKINAIGEVDYNKASKEVIEAARKAYDSLTDEQKKLVDPAVLKKLTDAEATYTKAKAEAEKKEAEEAEKKAAEEAEKKAAEEAEKKAAEEAEKKAAEEAKKNSGEQSKNGTKTTTTTTTTANSEAKNNGLAATGDAAMIAAAACAVLGLGAVAIAKVTRRKE